MMEDAIERKQLVGRAREFAPVLLERAPAAEEMRRLPDETHRDLVDAGLYRLFRPTRYDGLELDFGALVDITVELARGCGSTAWVYANLASHSWVIGMMEPRTQDEVWKSNPTALAGSAFQGPDATVAKVDGGLLVDGLWNFSSGIDFAEWNLLQVFVPSVDGPPAHRFALVRASEHEIVDDWFANGLAATGSKSVRLEKVFIPDHRTLAATEMVGRPTPGSAVNPAALYRLPFFGIGNKVFAAPSVGIALGALEAIERDIGARVSAVGVKLSEQPTVHLKIGEASAEVEAARALLERDCVECSGVTEAGGLPTVEQRARWRRNNAFAGKLCAQAVERLYPLAGGRGLAFASRFQRCWRDVHAAVSQVAMAWDVHGTFYGRSRFGLELSDPRAFPSS